MAYTSQETGPLGYQCPHLEADLYHVFDHVELRINRAAEIIASVRYPDGQNLLNHSTGDTGALRNEQTCKCGFKGQNLIFQGRLPNCYNIKGTSIDIREFSNVLNDEFTSKINITDIQFVFVEKEEGTDGGILLIDERYLDDKKKIPFALYRSFIIREIINDLGFSILCMSKNHYF